jgi:hypothetical protein
MLGGLEQSALGECVLHVVGIKVSVLENRPSVDAAVGEERRGALSLEGPLEEPRCGVAGRRSG